MRFSLRTLLAATALVSVVCCVFFALPNWLAALVLFLSAIFIPAMAVSTVVFAQGYWRAFGIGCLVTVGFWPLITSYYMITIVISAGSVSLSDIASAYSDGSESLGGMKVGFAITYGLVALTGLSSVTVRWLAFRSQDRATREEPSTDAVSEPSPLDRYEVLSGRVSLSEDEPGPLPDPMSDRS